ncbi:MAG: zinc-binding protein [Proteobacteria bacterium]|nr:zinc-binding protein [Pseudomonadota bacterium]
MNILDLLQADGVYVKRVATTKGGEYSGPCPLCQDGKDRFRVWPEQGDGGRWWCRQCGRSGDCIQFLRDYRKMGFRDACQYVGREVTSPTPSLSGRKAARTIWEPRVTTAPTDLWQERARRLVEESENWLFHPSIFGQKMLGWLKERRGLSEETIKKYRLGLIPINRWEGHEQWGLEPDLKEDGTPKKIWLPRGLTIPLCLDGNILRIRIRRPKMDLKSGDDRRYQTIRGADSRAMLLEPHRDIQVVVESDLDAILVVQEAQGLVGAVSLGTAGKTPDKEAVAVFRRSRLILVSLDSDDAGAKAAWRWWLNHFPQARRWPPVGGKDPGDMLLAGMNLRTWIEAGIDEYGEGSGDLAHVQAMEAEPPLHLAGAEEEPVFEENHETVPPSTPVTLSAVPATTSPDLLESTFTCFSCSHFRPAVSPNPTQAFGRCEKRRRGRFGVATACRVMAVAPPCGD